MRAVTVYGALPLLIRCVYIFKIICVTKVMRSAGDKPWVVLVFNIPVRTSFPTCLPRVSTTKIHNTERTNRKYMNLNLIVSAVSSCGYDVNDYTIFAYPVDCILHTHTYTVRMNNIRVYTIDDGKVVGGIGIHILFDYQNEVEEKKLVCFRCIVWRIMRTSPCHAREIKSFFALTGKTSAIAKRITIYCFN